MAPAAAADGVAGAAVDGAAATDAGADAAAVAIDAAAVAAAWNLICKWPSSWSGYPVGRHF